MNEYGCWALVNSDKRRARSTVRKVRAELLLPFLEQLYAHTISEVVILL